MKKFLFPALLFFIMASFSWPFFHSGMFVTHDGENHIARLASYFQAFSDGQMPPRWAENLNYRFGSPLLLFFYPLPGYLGSLIHLLGLHYEDCMKSIFLFGFIGAPLAFYAWAKNRFSSFVSFAGAAVYGLIPYHILDVYVRGDIGEVLSFIFIPLIFLSIDSSNQTATIKKMFIGGICTAGLILSHNIMSLMFLPVIVLYILVFSNSKKGLFAGIASIVIGLLLSLFFWLPALSEHIYLSAMFVGNFYQQNFPTIQQLLYSAWGFGPDIHATGGLSVQLGPLQLVTILSACLFLFYTKDRKEVLFWLLVSLIGIFMALDWSLTIWAHAPLLPQFQFPWRFVALATFGIAVVFLYIADSIKNRFVIFCLVFLALIFSFQLVGVKGYINKSDSYYHNFPGTTYFHGEATTRWTAGDESKYATSFYQFIAGMGKIVPIKRTSVQHEFAVSSRGEASIVDNTIFFPGWLVYVDGKETPIQFQDPSYRGLITFTVPEGKHTIVVIFKETRIRKIANGISSFTLIMLLLTIALSVYKKHYGKKV